MILKITTRVTKHWLKVKMLPLQMTPETVAVILKYFHVSVGLINKLRETMYDIQLSMNEIITKEINLVDREYIFGIFVLAVLFLIPQIITVRIRNAVNASLKSKVRDLSGVQRL